MYFFFFRCNDLTKYVFLLKKGLEFFFFLLKQNKMAVATYHS